MVICESYNFVFLRIPKNASSTMCKYFIENYCKTSDRYTMVNEAKIPNTNIPHEVVMNNKKDYHYIHMTLQELVDYKLVSRGRLKEMRVIGILRDPIERQISLHYFLQNKFKKTVTPENFRENFRLGHHITDTNNLNRQVDYLRLDGDVIGEWWIYDKLQEHVDAFASAHDKSSDLGRLKANLRIDQKYTQDELYDAATYDAVRDYFREDVELYEKLTGKSI